MSTVLLPPVVASAPAPRLQRPVRRGSRDWLPVLGWFVEDGQRHSRVNVIPLGNTRDPGERFMALLKFYRGAEEPAFTYLSDSFAGDQNFRFEGAQLLAALGASHFEGMVEITARSLDEPPTHFPWIDSWLEFWSDDGTFSGSVPGFVFKGGTTKRVMSGKWQHWPGAVANDEYQTSVLLLNYHPRPTQLRLDLFAPSGRMRSSTTLEVPPRSPGHFALETHVPDARGLLGCEGGIGSLRIWSAYKLPGFVTIGNRNTGVITSFDHTVPYAGAPVE
ncbi:MAG: hypothetical protein JO023_25925 [Chloroflexi bacterium]|nr:hypothetical protein [Chloroflexota bacterium]